MNDTAGEPTTYPQTEVTVNVIDQEVQKREELEKLKIERSKKCMEEISVLLEKYNCKLDLALTISTEGRITGSVNIKAK